MLYADTSFLVSLLYPDAASTAVLSAYRHLGRPVIGFSHLNEMEVRNTLRAALFTAMGSLPAKELPKVEMAKLKAEGKLATLIERGQVVLVKTPWEAICRRFEAISRKHTSEIGCRTLDVLHVACARAAWPGFCDV